MIPQLMPPDDPWFGQFGGTSQAPPVAPSGATTLPNGTTVAGGSQNTAPAPAPGANGGRGDPDGFRAAWFASGGKTVDDLKAFVAANPQYGATITGSKGSKLTFPGGQAFQAVRSAGMGGGIGPAWDDISGGGGAGGSLGALGYGYGSSMAPFTPPTAEDALNSPGVKFGLEEANRMMQIGPAAKGTLLNGRVQQAIAASNVGNALQAYGQVYDRAYQTQTRNQDAPFNKAYQLAQLGKPGA